MALLNNTSLNPSSPSLAAASESNWDWFNKSVERASFPSNTVTAESTLILAGPALFIELANNTSDPAQTSSRLTPIGFAQNITISEQHPVNRHFEIGSGRAKFTIGKSQGSAQVARALFDASSLLYVLQQNASKALNTPYVPTFFTNSANNKYGFGLWSDAFKIPFGMALSFKTSGNDYVASMYLEQAYISGHQVAVNEGGALVVENVRIEFDRIRTVNLRFSGPPGIPDANASTGGGVSGVTDVLNTSQNVLNTVQQTTNAISSLL